MDAPSASWSRPADGRPAALAALVAAGVFLATWWGLHHDFFLHAEISDLPLYRDYGNAMERGLVPYRDFAVEYPPAALPFFALLGMASALRSLRAAPQRLGAALAFAALAPLALGAVVLTRFDLWPAALTVGALAAVLRGRNRLGLGVLGLGIAAKVYPAVLVPIFLVHVWRRRGAREALVCAGVCALVVAAVFVPFLVLAPHGVWASVVRQTTRPLQIESVGAAALIVAHHVGGLHLTLRSSFGSQNLVGAIPHDTGRVLTVLQVGTIAGVWAWFWRGDSGSRDRLVTASAAAVCAFVALGKVLSPQFLIWLVPLVPLVRGRRGLAASTLLAGALVLTQLWFPSRYWWLVYGFHTRETILVASRDAILLVLLAVLLWPSRALEPPDELQRGFRAHRDA
ncbi:MAG: DUF2029 domain-containing protein [Actinobacteria bacterium]|nr:MAG: DUF2029 domain-containing protein [Actinomycetota bacterium]